ncbi:MAG: hypothetical protein ABSC94_00615 [Polyangiaceae bacterium]
MKARLWWAMAGVSVAWEAGCSTLYDLDKYSTGDAAVTSGVGNFPIVGSADAGVPGADASSASAIDAAADSSTSDGGPNSCGSQGGGNALVGCTNAVCVPFDNSTRIQGYVADAALPALPDAEASPASPVIDGGGDSSADGGTPVQAAWPACSSLPSPVYVIGSTGLAGLAAELGQLTSTVPTTLVFASARSCDGAKAIIQNQTAFDLGVTTATYWDVTGTAHTCQIDNASEYADIGLGQLFADACLTLPQGTPGIGDFLGPVTPIDMVVPTTSTQTSISAEALYYTVGLGRGAVAPWTDPSNVFYNPGSGPQYDVSVAIGVPPAQWVGTTVTTASQNIAKVGTSPDPEGTLGMMGSDLVEDPSNTSTIKAIAYQDVGQSCGYYPNDTPTSAEKQNVRDGHYSLWGFSHMFAKVNPQNVPLNPNAASLVSFFTGDQPTPTGDFLTFIINDHLVPVCAMQVTRDSEMGRLMPFTASPSCGCYFDSLTKGSSTCQACSANSDCPNASPHCNLGFCEAN